MKRNISRAVLLAAAAIIGSSALAPGALSAEQITIGSAGGQYDTCVTDAFLKDWEAQTGIKPVFGTPYYNMGAWKVQQETGKTEWDVALSSGSQFFELLRNGWIVPIDASIIERNGGLIDFKGLAPEKDGKVYALPAEIYGNVITYNTEKFGNNPPTTWADVFDTKKYPGKRLFSNRVAEYGTLEVALLADGVPPDHLYPLDVDRALKKLDTIKNDILWYESGAQQVSLLQQGDAVIGLAWDGRVRALARSGAKVDYQQSNAIVRVDYWVLPKGGNEALGAKFLDFVTRPQAQAKWASCMGYASGFAKAYDYIADDERITLRPNSIGNVIPWNGDYWRNNAEDVVARFNEWLTR
jgi:putative spermidine/putrescine transport system substrate-binding protein